MLHDLALIIPCFNEEKRIVNTANLLISFFNNDNCWKHKNACIVFVDDGSTDNTYNLLKGLKLSQTSNLTIKIIRHEKNKGKGAAIKSGTLTVDANIYGFTDADLSYSPNYINQALNSIKTHDALLGQRIYKQESGYSKIRFLISAWLKKINSFLFNIPNIDIQCGFKFFNNKVAKNIIPRIHSERYSFDVELLFLLMKNKCSINFLPVNFKHNNLSKINFLDGIRYVLDILSISDRFYKFNRNLYLTLLGVSILPVVIIFGWIIFTGYFFSDDFTWLWYGKQFLANPLDIFSIKADSFFSPFITIFYAVIYGIFGPSAKIFFTIGILVHILNSFLVGILGFQLSKSRIISIISALLFSIAGSAYEPIVWIGANMHSLSVLFILLNIIFYNYYLTSYKNKFLFISLLSFLTALSIKEMKPRSTSV